MTAEPEVPPAHGPEPQHGSVRRRTGEFGRRRTSAVRFNLLFLRGGSAAARGSATPAPAESTPPTGSADSPGSPGAGAGATSSMRLHDPMHRDRARRARRTAEPKALPLPRTGVPLIAVAHGTTDPAGIATINALLKRVSELRPGLEIRTTFLSVARPRLADVLNEYASRPMEGSGCTSSQNGRVNAAVTKGGGEVAVLPLFLGAGYHERQDTPPVLDTILDTVRRGEARTGSNPARLPLRIHRCRPLGPDPLLADVLRDRLTRVGGTVFGTQLVLAAAGSTTDEANADAVAMAGALAERLRMPVRTAFVSGSGPLIADVLGRLARRGRPIAVATYLLAEGELSRRIMDSATLAALEAESRSPIRVAAPLGAHDQVARLILRRYDTALARAADR